MARSVKERKLNVGCGKYWATMYPGWEGFDMFDSGQEHVGKVQEIRKIFAGSPFTHIMANHLVEHLEREEVIQFIKDCYSLLKDGGELKIAVPDRHKDKAWVLTHKTFFTRETFKTMEYEQVIQELDLPEWEDIKVVVNGRKDIHATFKKGKV